MISPSKYNKKVTKSVTFFVGPPKARTNLFQRCGSISNYVFLFSKHLTLDYFKYNGKYYLVFTLPGKAQYMVSDKPFEGFAPPSSSGVECAGVPKGAEWNGRLVFVGFKAIDGYAGTMTLKAATALDSGELVFEEL